MRLSILSFMCACCFFTASCAHVIPPAKQVSWVVIPSSTTIKIPQLAKIHIAVGPVSIPTYLNRSDLFIRDAESSASFNDSYLWVERLDDAIARVLSENLASELESKKMSVSPASFQLPASKRIFINIERFDGKMNSLLILSATWGVVNPQGDILKIGHYSASENVGASVLDLVASHGTALEKFAKYLAQQM